MAFSEYMNFKAVLFFKLCPFFVNSFQRDMRASLDRSIFDPEPTLYLLRIEFLTWNSNLESYLDLTYPISIQLFQTGWLSKTFLNYQGQTLHFLLTLLFFYHQWIMLMLYHGSVMFFYSVPEEPTKQTVVPTF